jgi:hypothetical protein
MNTRKRVRQTTCLTPRRRACLRGRGLCSAARATPTTGPPRGMLARRALAPRPRHGTAPRNAGTAGCDTELNEY